MCSENGAKQRIFHYKRVLRGEEISFPKENSAKRIYDMSVTLGDKRPSNYTVKNWVIRFRTGHLNLEDKNVLGDQLK
jgi:hypothetical protein